MALFNGLSAFLPFRISSSPRLVWILLSIIVLTGCGQLPALPPTASAHKPPSAKQRPATYLVHKGDTLYAIGFRYGLSIQQLASANALPPPYTIYPGQRLKLHASIPHTSAIHRQRTPSPRKQHKTQADTHHTAPKKHQPTAGKSHKKAWLWPVQGKMLYGFVKRQNRQHKKNGIGIAGKRGTPVKASRTGEVVYSGHGFPGYGKLLIIKHDEHYLSTYAHNSRLLAHEGDKVKRGQTIALMGRSDARRVLLHFEIRRDGKAVDPLAMLP